MPISPRIKDLEIPYLEDLEISYLEDLEILYLKDLEIPYTKVKFSKQIISVTLNFMNLKSFLKKNVLLVKCDFLSEILLVFAAEMCTT